MNGSKIIFQSRTIIAILLALLVPEVLTEIGVNIWPELLDLLRISLGDYVLTLDELIQIALTIAAVVFRFRATKTLYLTKKDDGKYSLE